MILTITNDVFKSLIEITREEKPNEACAYLFKNNTIVIKGKPKFKSVASFDDIDPSWVNDQIEKYGTPSSLFHSHPCDAFISSKDIIFLRITWAIWKAPWIVMSDKYKLKAFIYNGGHSSMEIQIKIV